MKCTEPCQKRQTINTNVNSLPFDVLVHAFEPLDARYTMAYHGLLHVTDY